MSGQDVVMQAVASGMSTAVNIMRIMALEPNIGLIDGPAALRIVADAIEAEAIALQNKAFGFENNSNNIDKDSLDD